MTTKDRKVKHDLAPPQRRLPLRQIEEAKALLPSPSATKPARIKQRHAAITDTLGRYGSYESWAKGMRARWK
jgi:hypothetical protein